MTPSPSEPRAEAMSGGEALREAAQSVVAAIDHDSRMLSDAVIALRAALAETPESRETLDVERLHRAANKALMGGQTRAATDAIAAEYAALRSPDTVTAGEAG